MKMSTKKQVCQPLLHGMHSRGATRQSSQEGMKFNEFNTVKLNARYLGPSLTIASTNNKNEIRARRKAANNAVARYQGMFSANLTPSVRRLLFRSHVLSKTLSASEALAWGENDIRAIDKIVSATGRNCMRGKAVRRIKLTDNEGNVLIDEISSMSTQEVYEVWQSPGTGMELLTRRCKMYQRWARDVQEHQQILATLFGRFAWESRDTVAMV